jgi:NADPH:quinone reductase-like Zn-dependent oxidoreductase
VAGPLVDRCTLSFDGPVDRQNALPDSGSSQACSKCTPSSDSIAGSRSCASMSCCSVTPYATVFAVDPGPGDTVVVSGAAGGVGSLAVQLARRRGATVIGLASERNHTWLKDRGVVPVAYGEGVAERIRQASDANVDAFIDTFGDGYVELAVELGVQPERINTIHDWQAAAKVGARTYGEGSAACAVVLGELARLAGRGELEVPIARTYPLERVRDAFRELEQQHTHGKIVLRP